MAGMRNEISIFEIVFDLTAEALGADARARGAMADFRSCSAHGDGNMLSADSVGLDASAAC